MESGNLLLLIDRVESFYESAWLKLIVAFSGLLGLIGIFIPLIVNWLQRRAFRLDEQNFELRLERNVEELKKNLSNKISEEMKKISESIENKLATELSKYEKKNNGAMGGLFHLEGNFNKDYPSIALGSYLTSIQYYLASDTEANLFTVLELAEEQLNLLFKDDFDNDEELEPFVFRTIELLKDGNSTGKFTRRIDFMKRNLATAKNKIRPVTT